MTKTEQLTGEHSARLRTQLKALRGREGWSNARIAEALGVSRAVVSQLISDKYAGRSQNHHWVAIEKFLATIALQTELMPLVDHVNTPTSARIMEALGWAHQQGDIALVYGLAGAGKTWTARRYADEHSGVTMIAATPACNTVYALLRLLARSLDLDVLGSASRVESAVLEALAGSTPRLLILDEAHHLPQAVLDEVRCVYDAAGGRSGAPFGLALLGNEPLRNTLMSTARCAQIISRIGRTVPLNTLAMGDVEAVIKELATDAKPAKLLETAREVAAKPGALRRLVKVGRDALALAKADGREHIESDDLLIAEQVRIG